MVSDQIKIAIVSGATKSADSVRGIGAHTSELFKIFRKNSDKNISDPNLDLKDDFSKFDVVHFTVFRPFFISLPFFKPKNTKFILTIHDLIPLVYPKHYISGLKGKIRFLINKYLIHKNVDRIITISETSKKDICRFLDVNPEIVKVIYLGPKEAHHPLVKGKWVDEIKNKYNLPDKFALYLGDVNYNKNILTMIKACGKADIKLVISGKQAKEIEFGGTDLKILQGPLDYIRFVLGKPHPELAHYDQLVKAFKDNDVARLGFVTDEEVNQMMNLAICTVQPSFYEGFGLSVVHAFASGCPVIVSKTQALVEVAEDACLYFDPNSVTELTERIKMLTNSEALRQEYIKKGFERVKKFSWKKAADETLKVYRKA